MHHGYEVYLQRKALLKLIVENVRTDRKHIGVEAGVCLGVGVAGPPLQRLEIRPRHLHDL